MKELQGILLGLAITVVLMLLLYVGFGGSF